MLPVVLLAISDPDDRSFMESLYVNYNRLMYSEIYKVMGDGQAVEDILQESLIKLIDKIPLLKTLDKSRRINYIITTVKNMSRNYLRKQIKRSVCSLDDENSDVAYTVSDGTDIEEHVILNYEKYEFEKAWAKLDETSQTLLEGKYILEKNDTELGEMLGIKPSSVRMILSRTRRKAIKIMTEEYSFVIR